MADGAVVRHVAVLFEVLERNAAARLLFVQKGFSEETRREDLVARTVEQVSARHVRRADRLAFSAAQAVLDHVGDLPDVGLFEDETLRTDQCEARRVCVAEIAAGQKLALVEVAVRIDARLVFLERFLLVFVEKLELRDADAVFT
jgi:hypothetical protein